MDYVTHHRGVEATIAAGNALKKAMAAKRWMVAVWHVTDDGRIVQERSCWEWLHDDTMKALALLTRDLAESNPLETASKEESPPVPPPLPTASWVPRVRNASDDDEIKKDLRSKIDAPIKEDEE